MAKLGINIDHVATIREARKTIEPDPLYAAFLAETAGCHGITIHLREDERHIKTEDLYMIKEKIRTRLNLEMSINSRIVNIACKVVPNSSCLVPEKREEITTEGGLAVSANLREIAEVVNKLKKNGITVSLFIDAVKNEIHAAKKSGADCIEIHTGTYANAVSEKDIKLELRKITEGIILAKSLGLTVNAGHGLTYFNIEPLAMNQDIYEFNIGHAVISRAVFWGMERAVKDMLALLGYQV